MARNRRGYGANQNNNAGANGALGNAGYEFGTELGAAGRTGAAGGAAAGRAGRNGLNALERAGAFGNAQRNRNGQ